MYVPCDAVLCCSTLHGDSHHVQSCHLNLHGILLCNAMLPRRYARLDFTWLQTGAIEVVSHIQVLPIVSLRTIGDSNTYILVALVLLVLLTAVQLGTVSHSLWSRVSDATSPWRILQVMFT